MRNANGTGSIIKLGGKRRRPWGVRITAGWTESGKQVFKYLSYHEKRADAVRALAIYNSDPYDIEVMSITFAEVYEKWSERGYEQLSESAAGTYRSAYKHCAPLYNKKFRDLNTDVLQAVIDNISAHSMVGFTKQLLMKVYAYAMERDIVNKNYAEFIVLPKRQEPKKEKHPFTDAEVNILWENVGKVKYADLVLILLYTGMRVNELLFMEKKDVHLEERYMVGGLKTEAGKKRVIPIHHRILPLIEKCMEESTCETLFTNNYGTALKYSSFIRHHWPHIIELVKGEHTVHDTRHTFISNMDRAGVNRVTLQRIVGHAGVSVTDRYTHKETQELIDAVDLLK